MSDFDGLQLVWDITRAALLVGAVWGFMRLVFIAFDYLECLQGRVGRSLFAIRRRWYHRFTRRS